MPKYIIPADRQVLYSDDLPIQTFASGGRVTFNVTNSGLHGVTWYHNGTEVDGSDRITVSESQLIIHQAVSSDAGAYQLRITSLFSRCNESLGAWIHLLENLAAYAPITFILQEIDELPGNRIKTMIILLHYIYYPKCTCILCLSNNIIIIIILSQS